MRNSFFAAILLTASLLMFGCTPLVVGGIAATAVVSNLDRRTTGMQVEDEAIEIKVSSRIRTQYGESADVNVSSYNRKVLLTGYVKSATIKAEIKNIAVSVENVGSVFDELYVGQKATLSEKGADIATSARVKVALLDAKDLNSSAFKITTAQGSVYLMGRVTKREADRATAIATNIPNVKKVIRIFEEISERELADITPKEPK